MGLALQKATSSSVRPSIYNTQNCTTTLYSGLDLQHTKLHHYPVFGLRFTTHKTTPPGLCYKTQKYTILGTGLALQNTKIHYLGYGLSFTTHKTTPI